MGKTNDSKRRGTPTARQKGCKCLGKGERDAGSRKNYLARHCWSELRIPSKLHPFFVSRQSGYSIRNKVLCVRALGSLLTGETTTRQHGVLVPQMNREHLDILDIKTQIKPKQYKSPPHQQIINKSFGTSQCSEKIITILGDRSWPQTAKQKRNNKIRKIFLCGGGNAMSAHMLEVCLIEVKTVLCLEREAWSTVKSPRQTPGADVPHRRQGPTSTGMCR